MATRAEIKLQARRRADMEHSTFISDAELNDYVQGSYGELRDLLVAAYEDYYLTGLQVSVASGATSIPLPTDFYKLRGVDLEIGSGNRVALHQFNFAERNAANRATSRLIRGQNSLVYRLMGDSILLEPATQATGTYQVWYIPRTPVLSTDASILTGVLDFEEYVAVDSAIKMLSKEESDTSSLMMQKAALIDRIQKMAQDRDAGSPQTISDVTGSTYLDDTLFPR